MSPLRGNIASIWMAELRFDFDPKQHAVGQLPALASLSYHL
jgi:hypothetical protein